MGGEYHQQDLREIHHITGTRQIYDPFQNFLGTLEATPTHLRNGAAKDVYTSTFTFKTPDDKRAMFGPTGSFVHASPRPEARGHPITPLLAITNEHTWMLQFASATVNNGSTPRSIVRNLNPILERETMIEGIAFGETIDDILYTIDRVANNALAPSSQRYMLIAAIARTLAALDEFHSMRFKRGNHTFGVIHGDLGEFGHLNNLLLPARGGHATLIDYELVNLETEGPRLLQKQTWEKNLLVRHIINQLKDPKLIHIRNLLPPELQRALNTIAPHTAPEFSLDKLAEFADRELHAITKISGETEESALTRIQHQYFLAYLDTRLRDHVQTYYPVPSLEAISRGIDEIYQDNLPDAPTQLINTLALKGY